MRRPACFNKRAERHYVYSSRLKITNQFQHKTWHLHALIMQRWKLRIKYDRKLNGQTLLIEEKTTKAKNTHEQDFALYYSDPVAVRFVRLPHSALSCSSFIRKSGPPEVWEGALGLRDQTQYGQHRLSWLFVASFRRLPQSHRIRKEKTDYGQQALIQRRWVWSPQECIWTTEGRGRRPSQRRNQIHRLSGR